MVAAPYEQCLTHVCRDMIHALVLVDRQDRVLHMNPAAERLGGVSNGVTQGKPLRDVVALVEAESQRRVELPRMQTFKDDPQPHIFRHVFLKTGRPREIMVDASFFPFHDAQGEPAGYAATLIDIRETMARERNSLDRQKIEAISRMAENMAQDFSNWLSIISGHASTAMDSLIPNTRAHESAARIIEATEQAGALVQRLFAVASAAGGGDASSRETVSLGRITQDAVRLARATFLPNSIRCQVVHPENMPYVLCNSSGLLTCLINLLRNAADALADGGTITIDASERMVRDEPYAVLRVRDNGQGIGRPDLRRIFDPFFSTREGTVSGTGTGLGLTVVKELVEGWGGTVKVRSREGHGASFRIFLPRGTARPEEPPPAQPAAGGTVLVVDDEPDTRNRIQTVLNEAGFHVLTSAGNDECLQLFKHPSNDVHATVIDMFMPGQDVRTLIDTMQAVDPTLPIVIISGFSRDYVRARLQRGAWRFVQKPIDEQTLVSTVKTLVDQRRGEAGDGPPADS